MVTLSLLITDAVRNVHRYKSVSQTDCETGSACQDRLHVHSHQRYG